MVDRPVRVLDLLQGGAGVTDLTAGRLALLVMALTGRAELSFRLGEAVARRRLAAVLAVQLRTALEVRNPRLQFGKGCQGCRALRRAVRQLRAKVRVLLVTRRQFRPGPREVGRKLIAVGAAALG